MSFRKMFLSTLVFTVFFFGVSSICFGVIGAREGRDPFEALNDRLKEKGSVKEISISKQINWKTDQALTIRSVSSDIEIYQSTTGSSTIEVIGSATENLSDSIKLDVKVDEKGMTVKLIEDERTGENSKFDFFDLKKSIRFNDLKVKAYLASTPENLELVTVSGDVRMFVPLSKGLKVSSVSGEFIANGFSVENLDLKSISGDVKMKDSTLRKAQFEVVSGDVELEVINEDPEIKLNSVSGDGKFKFLSEPNFQVKLNSVSGDLKVHGESVNKKSWGGQRAKTLGLGKGQVEAHSTSGDLEIL
ncbi:DUF4097 domain-containing protein [bacterium]|nr:DUF4097 domain-containing protein [bacterium]